MINSLWISKTGMEAQQTQLDVISHNLANVSTTGYKRANAVFEDLMYQNLRQVGANSTEQSQLPTGLQLGLGVRTVATSRSFTQGSMQQTNNQLDVAIKGNGFFQVTHARRHHRLHPRRLVPGRRAGPAGDLLRPAGGQRHHGAGQRHQRQHRRPTARSRPRCPGQAAPQTVGTLALANFVNPAGLEPRGENLYAETAASGQPQRRHRRHQRPGHA